MNQEDIDVLLDKTATIQTEIEILPISDNEESIILNEENSIIKWDYEDYRYVKDEGWIGQFVARRLIAELKNISNNFVVEDRECILRLGIKSNDNTNWYSLGNFLIKKPIDNNVKDITKFEALDYTKKFNQTYVDRMTYPCTALELAQDVCSQAGCELGNIDFKNSDYTIDGNVFTNNETLRDVMKAIGKLAFSWVRIDWDNKVYIDFENNQTVDDNHKIDNSLYYSLETKNNNFGKVNRVVVGYKDADGEQTKIEDTEDIELNGVNELTIFDNPLVFTQDQRELIIEQARDLLGLYYRPCTFQTIGHPWLKGNEFVEIKDMEDNLLYTYPFDRTIQYFGHIKTTISSDAKTKTDTKYAYESDLDKRIRNAEFRVNKAEGIINAVVNEQSNQSAKLSQLEINSDMISEQVSSMQTTVDETSGQVTELEQTVRQNITSTNTQFETINKTLTDGVEKVVNDLVTIDNRGLEVSTSEDEFKALLSNKAVEISDSYKEIAFFGYDEDLQKTIARIEELETRKMTSGNHRCEPFQDEETFEPRSGWFYVGGVR